MEKFRKFAKSNSKGWTNLQIRIHARIANANSVWVWYKIIKVILYLLALYCTFIANYTVSYAFSLLKFLS